MRKLGGERAGTLQIKTIKPNDIASRLVRGAKVNVNPTYGRKIKEKLKKVKKEPNAHLIYTFHGDRDKSSVEKD